MPHAVTEWFGTLAFGLFMLAYLAVVYWGM